MQQINSPTEELGLSETQGECYDYFTQVLVCLLVELSDFSLRLKRKIDQTRNKCY